MVRGVCVAGVGLPKCGGIGDKSLEQMGEEAVRLALKDANNTDWRVIHVTFCALVDEGTAVGLRVLSR